MKLAHPAADLLGVVVHPGHHAEGAVVEAQVLGEGAPQVSHADDHHGVLAVEAEQGVQVVGQGVDVVADAADAELAELGEVLADLGGGEVVALRHLLRGDPLDLRAPGGGAGSAGRTRAG